MRASGIGPAGTLVAQGVLTEGAKVVLADFESSDEDLADVVTGALRVDLLQSPTIRIVERTELASALERMQLDKDATISGDVARELASREGYGAVIEGEIGTAGAGYVLTASIVGGADWTSLAAFRATARSEDDLIDAIESLSRDIRDKSGESLRTVGSSPPLRRVTTGSIEALRAYSRAEALESEGDNLGAVELYERAIEIDPEFAMAYRKVGVNLGNIGIRRTDQVAALRRAYELRERLPETEAYLAEAYFQAAVRGDRQATIRAYERLLEIDPSNVAALNNLALVYSDMGRNDDAEGLLERALDIEAFDVAFFNLAGVRYALDEDEASEEALDVGVEALPGAAAALEDLRIQLTFNRQDYDRARDLTTAFGERFPGARERVFAATRRYTLDAVHGRLKDAARQVDGFDEAPSFAGHPVVMSVNRNLLVALRGDTALAVRTLVGDFSQVRDTLPPGERLYGLMIPVLLDLDAEAEGVELLDEWGSQVPEDEIGLFGRDARREIDARLAFARGDLTASLRRWEEYERECPGTCAAVAALGLAKVHDAAGDGDRAVEQYERYLADRGSDRSFIDAANRAPAVERLGHLYADRGDTGNASLYLGMFVDLWADADAELQPRVQAAQTRLDAMAVASP
jgi:tetratricopeptide (TPR) repeat protein